ncbi:MAG: CDP-diacylglycerol--serine O-phosphatidyltransferase [Chromatiales bacterium]|nr:CDP-diacylglycerol--serine O-phosphatidyltransferase [Chromatiales bacterium]
MEQPVKPRRGIYLLPNLFTTSALFAGFYAIVSAMDGRFESAAAAVFIAMVLDGLDGRVARLTNTQSEFGAQYDSLADMVSFGVAPALVMYEWALSDLGRYGWVAAFVYTACAALRLARFNTQIGSVDKRFFVGLASPAAAAVVVGFVWIAGDFGMEPRKLAWVAWAVTVAAGLLMVSNMRYYSFKTIDFKGKVPFFFLLVAVLIFVLVTIDPPKVLFVVFAGYAISGLVTTVWMLMRRRRQVLAGEETEKPDDSSAT